MSDNIKYDQEALLANLLIRVSVLEHMLITNKVCTLEELTEKTTNVSKEFAKSILINSGVSEEEVNKFIQDFKLDVQLPKPTN